MDPVLSVIQRFFREPSSHPKTRGQLRGQLAAALELTADEAEQLVQDLIDGGFLHAGTTRYRHTGAGIVADEPMAWNDEESGFIAGDQVVAG